MSGQLKRTAPHPSPGTEIARPDSTMTASSAASTKIAGVATCTEIAGTTNACAAYATDKFS